MYVNVSALQTNCTPEVGQGPKFVCSRLNLSDQVLEFSLNFRRWSFISRVSSAMAGENLSQPLDRVDACVSLWSGSTSHERTISLAGISQIRFH